MTEKPNFQPKLKILYPFFVAGQSEIGTMNKTLLFICILWFWDLRIGNIYLVYLCWGVNWAMWSMF